MGQTLGLSVAIKSVVFILIKSPLSKPIKTGNLDFLHKRRRPQQRGEGIQVLCMLGQKEGKIDGGNGQVLTEVKPYHPGSETQRLVWSRGRK